MDAETQESFTSLATMTEEDFRHISHYIHNTLGIKMPPQKKTMVEGRLRKRLRACGVKTFKQYREFIFGDGGTDELIHFCNAVTTNKTDFFREPAHFTYLVNKALPELVSKYGVGFSRPLRVWSAGCSTGEEPYTLAIVLNEFARENPGFKFTILGTDLSTRVLETARTAVYALDKVAPVPLEMKKLYLLKSKDRDGQKPQARANALLRSQVQFQRLNFMDDDYDLPFSFDIVFCRNVLIYFDRPTQKTVLERISRNILPGRYLFIGHSETLHGLGLPLNQEAPTIYRKQSLLGTQDDS